MATPGAKRRGAAAASTRGPSDNLVLYLPITGRYIPFMRSAAPALLPIFRSQHQAALLAWLLLHPEHEYTLTELAKRLDVPLTTLQREAQRLVGAGILQDRTLGRARLLRANLSNRAAAPLTQLLEVTFGPETVIGEEFASKNAERVLIYGSWADRYHGTPGPPPNDVDVLIVGSLDRADIYDAADRAQERLGIQVNPVIRTSDQWANDSDALVLQIKASPMVDVTAVGDVAS